MRKKSSRASRSPRPSRAAVKETWRPEAKPSLYPFHYGPPGPADIEGVLKRIHAHLEKNTPPHIVDRATGRTITNLSKIPSTPGADIAQGLFRLISYEWGVVHSGMMLASKHTGDTRYAAYTARRLQLMADAVPWFRKLFPNRTGPHGLSAFVPVLYPNSLDDAGSLCAAMIKAHRGGLAHGLLPVIENYIDHIIYKQQRLPDGAFARNRPIKDSLWLDDLYMSVPALAQMYGLAGETRYADEAIRQIDLFASRMFRPSNNLFMHGWFEGRDEHPAFHWGRANGWAMLSMTELLDVLPDGHAGRDTVLSLFRRHARGVAACQGGQGFWHQLLDRNDSFTETSATAIFAYCLARAANRGWIDKLAFGPAALAAWNAAASRVNAQGEVGGTCVGSAMAMDPVYYYHRHQSPLAAHGYGPMLLAGAEILALVKTGEATAYDGATQFAPMLDEN